MLQASHLQFILGSILDSGTTCLSFLLFLNDFDLLRSILICHFGYLLHDQCLAFRALQSRYWFTLMSSLVICSTTCVPVVVTAATTLVATVATTIGIRVTPRDALVGSRFGSQLRFVT